MSKEFICPSCSAPIIFAGGESIFQTCKTCNAPIIVPSEFLYKGEAKLASEEFASLVNDKPVDVEQVTNELTPGSNLPESDEIIDKDARIEKFEVYQEKLGTHAVETKKVVDEIVAPKENDDFKTRSPFANDDGSISMEVPDSLSIEIPEELKAKKTTAKIDIYPILARVRNELQRNGKIEAIKIFRSKFNTSLRDAKEAVEAIERGENIDISQYLNQ
jgi:hypothetical protein